MSTPKMDINMFKTIMIRIPNNPVSERYAQKASASWEGFNLRYYDAITPETLSAQSGLTFGKRGNDRELTDTEKACFYSQYNLWKKCAVENVPILILEHDAWLQKPSAINFNPDLQVQFFGQHASPTDAPPVSGRRRPAKRHRRQWQTSGGDPAWLPTTPVRPRRRPRHPRSPPR